MEKKEDKFTGWMTCGLYAANGVIWSIFAQAFGISLWLLLIPPLLAAGVFFVLAVRESRRETQREEELEEFKAGIEAETIGKWQDLFRVFRAAITEKRSYTQAEHELMRELLWDMVFVFIDSKSWENKFVTQVLDASMNLTTDLQWFETQLFVLRALLEQKVKDEISLWESHHRN